MKGLKTILNNKDVLCRFRLLQLWCIDTFTKSLTDGEPSLTKLINDTVLTNDIKLNPTPEDVFNTLISLKKEYEIYNQKLMQIQKLIELQNTYAKVLNIIDKDISAPSDDSNTELECLINKNNKLIDGINNINISMLNDALTNSST